MYLSKRGVVVPTTTPFFMYKISHILNILTIMINRNESKKLDSSELIKQYSGWLRFRKGYGESTISLSCYIIQMLARDLEVSLLDADTLQIREVLCRYYDKVKPTTLNQYRSIIVSFYRFLYINEYIDKNPAIDIPIRKVNKSMPKFIEKSTIDMILRHDFNENNRIEFQQKCIFELMLLCGMKCGEIANLTIYNCIITEGGISVMPDNTKKARIYPSELIEDSCILRYIKSCSQDCIELFPSYGNTAAIRNMVRAFMVKYCDLYNITPMTLRHSFAKTMINRGVRDIYVAHLLGTRILNYKKLYDGVNIDVIKKEYNNCFNRE